MKTRVIRFLKKTGLFPFLKKIKLWTEVRTRGMMRFYSQFIRKNNLCFDIGANLGARTEIFLGLGARVIAIEPQSLCVASLTKTFENADVTIVPKAVGSSIGTGEISLCDDTNVIATMSSRWKTEGRFSQGYSWNKKETVSVTTLNALITEFGVPQFCKIDVEGFEEEVLKGLSQKIPCLSFEFTIEFFDTAIRILERLSSLGTITCNYSVSESHKLELKNWIPSKDLINCIHQEKHSDLWGDIYIKMS